MISFLWSNLLKKEEVIIVPRLHSQHGLLLDLFKDTTEV